MPCNTKPAKPAEGATRRGAALVEAVLAAGLVAATALALAAPITRALAIATEGRSARERLQLLARHAGDLAAAAHHDACGRWPAAPAPLTRELATGTGTWRAVMTLAGPRGAADTLRVAGACAAAP